jgi:hypothetical protein
MQEKLEMILTVVTLLGKKYKEMVAPMVGSGGISYILEQGDRFCVGAFGRNQSP